MCTAEIFAKIISNDHDYALRVTPLIIVQCTTITIKIALPIGLKKLELAIESGDVEATKRIVDNFPSGDLINRQNATDGHSVLTRAIDKNNAEIVEVLLGVGDIKVDKKHGERGTPLEFAIAKNSVDIVAKLLNDGASGDTKALSWAISKGHKEIVEELVRSSGVDLSQSDAATGYTPLTGAAKSGRTDIVEVLLSHDDAGNIINSSDSNNKTPLLVAVEEAQVDVVKQLVNREDIVVNKAIGEGPTALELAKEKQKQEEMFETESNEYAEIVHVLEKASTVIRYSIDT